jgi:hypothetical protein
MKSVLYAMASWSGSRTNVTFDDSYVERHIEQLKKIKNNITQISIGNPDNPSKRLEFEEYIKSLTNVSGVPVVVHDVPNIGRSYGQWSRMYEQYRNQFDYYIFVEDDYQPALDNFDTVLIDMYEKKNCGFLCGLILDKTGRYGIKAERHAGITNGIASSSALEKVRDRFCCLPHDMGEYANGQIIFSNGFLESGLSIAEYIDTGEYRALYYDQNEKIRIYGPNKNAKDIFSPAQIIGKKSFQYIHFKEIDRPIGPIGRTPKSRVIGRRR